MHFKFWELRRSDLCCWFYDDVIFFLWKIFWEIKIISTSRREHFYRLKISFSFCPVYTIQMTLYSLATRQSFTASYRVSVLESFSWYSYLYTYVLWYTYNVYRWVPTKSFNSTRELFVYTRTSWKLESGKHCQFCFYLPYVFFRCDKKNKIIIMINNDLGPYMYKTTRWPTRDTTS